VLVFGNSVESYVPRIPLPFDRRLAEKLSLNIKFLPDRTEKQAIVWSTRAWRKLTQKDVEILKSEIELHEESLPVIKPFMSSDEVFETLEYDIESYLAGKPELLGKELKLIDRQQPIAGGRLDLLFEKTNGDWVVVEVKLNRIGRHAIRQIKRYITQLRQVNKDKNITGIIVGSGVMPAYEEVLLNQKDIKIFVYGWDLQVREL
jgi:RecB family endonuclease NucS